MGSEELRLFEKFAGTGTAIVHVPGGRSMLERATEAVGNWGRHASAKASARPGTTAAAAAGLVAAGVGGKMLHSAVKARKAKALLRKRLAIGAGAAGAAGGLGAALASRRR